MKLQLALDMLRTEEALRIAGMTREFVDIIEIGTPLIKHEGVKVLEAFRAQLPDKTLLVDLKIMDAGEYESGYCFEAGADLVTVLGVADMVTIEAAVKGAETHGGQVVVDLINVADQAARATEVEGAGADYVAVHSGIDQQRFGQSPLSDLETVMRAVRIPVAVAGGINLQTLPSVVDLAPSIVVVGSAITSADSPREMARRIRAVMA